VAPSKHAWSKRSLTGAALLGACALAVLASFTHPFTLGADVVTALPLGAMVAAESARLIGSRRSRVRAAARPGQVDISVDNTIGSPAIRGIRGFIPWIVLSALVVGFELFNYFELPRHAHPTLSSLSDEVTRSPAGTALLFVAWLALGALLLKRAAPVGRAGTASGTDPR
jgi:hypothetical protein